MVPDDLNQALDVITHRTAAFRWPAVRDGTSPRMAIWSPSIFLALRTRSSRPIQNALVGGQFPEAGQITGPVLVQVQERK